MQVAGINKRVNKNFTPSFGNAFYNATCELDASVMLSRALVDGLGCTVPWILMANNNTERKEKSRKFLFDYAIAYLSPFIMLPFTNRLGAKYAGKLTKKLWSNNHKAIHISNEYLKDSDSMMKELTRMSKKTTRGPVEALYNKFGQWMSAATEKTTNKPLKSIMDKLTPKKYEQKIDVNELLKACGNDKEVLRQKLIKAKEAVFVSDCLLTFGILGSVPFVNNEITKKKSGQAGFSAEMSMADKETVEKRAEQHEKTKKKKYAAFLGVLAAMTFGMSALAFSSLRSKKTGKLVQALKNGSKMFDYNKGMYMSRLPFFLGYLTSLSANLLASRNETERKDMAIRQGIGSAIFYGGDLVLASLFANASDRLFGTKMRKTDGNKSFIRQIFPKVKPVAKVVEEVEQGKISKVNKKVAAGIFWADMIILMGTLGFFLPKAINKMIKTDVNKDVEANKKEGVNGVNGVNGGVNTINNTSQPATVKPTRMDDYIKRLKG